MNAESAYKEAIKKFSVIFRRLGATPVCNTIGDLDEVTPESFLDNVNDMVLYYSSKNGAVEGDVVYEDNFDPDDYPEEEKKKTHMINIYNDDYVSSNMVSKILGESNFDTYTGRDIFKVRVKCFDGQDIVYPASSKSNQIAIVGQIRDKMIQAGVDFV